MRHKKNLAWKSPTSCKAMEGVNKGELMMFLEEHILLSRYKNGGRPGRSTLTNLLCWLEELGERVDLDDP